MTNNDEVWVEVRRGGRLLFRYDPTENRVAIKRRERDVPDIIDLKTIKPRPTRPIRQTPQDSPRSDGSI